MKGLGSVMDRCREQAGDGSCHGQLPAGEGQSGCARVHAVLPSMNLGTCALLPPSLARASRGTPGRCTTTLWQRTRSPSLASTSPQAMPHPAQGLVKGPGGGADLC